MVLLYEKHKLDKLPKALYGGLKENIMAGTYRLRNIRLKGNEHGKLRANTIYAELAHENGSLAIAATLEHILKTIRNKKLAVDSVTISWEPRRDTYCSEVHLTKYPTHKRGK